MTKIKIIIFQIKVCLKKGFTEVGGTTSDILQKVQLDIIPNQNCSNLYNDEDNYRIFPSQVCAGVLKGGKDTCGGIGGFGIFFISVVTIKVQNSFILNLIFFR